VRQILELNSIRSCKVKKKKIESTYWSSFVKSVSQSVEWEGHSDKALRASRCCTVQRALVPVAE